MPKMTIKGNLKSILDDLAFSLSQVLVSDGGTKVTLDQSGFSLITLWGEGTLRVPSSGGEFMTGTIDDLRMNETTIDGLVIGRPLLIENMGLSAQKLFDLTIHSPLGNYGSGDPNALRKYLNNQDWKLVGSGGSDIIEGSVRISLGGDDTILGKGGTDFLKGGAGRDKVSGGGGSDSVFGQAGKDVLYGNNGKDGLEGGGGNDRLYGGDDNDLLYGDADHDRMWGGRGIDVLRGGAGQDRIEGGGGRDLLYGGLGQDTFVFGKNDGIDRIADFQNNIDVLKFDKPGSVKIKNTADGALVTHSEGEVLLTGISAGQLSLDDGLWS